MIKKTNNRFLYTLLLAIAGSVMITGCRNKSEKIDSTNAGTANTETMADTTAADESIVIPESGTSESGSDAADTADGGTGSQTPAQNTSTRMNTYTSGNISIQYPSIINLNDENKTTAIDTLIRDNALSLIEALQIDPAKDTLEITCNVLSADKARITITYEGYLNTAGAAHPVNLFYSNTIDVAKADNIGFSRYADPYTMAGYVMSDDCLFLDKTPQQTEEIRSHLHSEGTLNSFTQMFNNADFPFTADFPSSFSYEHEGTIFFSVPVTHALGDYVIVMYTPENK